MKREEIVKILRTIFVSILKHEKFKMENNLSAKDVDGWDSLSHILIITEIEKHFKIKFKLKELNSLDNLGNLIELVESKTS